MYRLTLVKQWNTDELQGYADLVSLGQPDFIEVKVIIIVQQLHDVVAPLYVSVSVSLSLFVSLSLPFPLSLSPMSN